ncbi:MAG: hypothetical protein Q8K26_05170 [Candidatus Gracilibacteria bacterium]|nr:hypothetical protein [Candidatus Gracilibacteria bacterium]
MKKTLLITTGIIVLGALLVGSAHAARGQMSSRGMGFAQRSNSGVVNQSLYASKITRAVNNIANGVEITMTTTDAATLTHMQSMFDNNQAKTPANSLITVKREKLANGTKITMTSTDAATVKSIQERAAAGKMGAFGQGGMGGKHGKMEGKRGGGKGGMRGGNNGNCPMVTQ